MTDKVNSYGMFKHWSRNEGGMHAGVRDVKWNTLRNGDFNKALVRKGLIYPNR